MQTRTAAFLRGGEKYVGMDLSGYDFTDNYVESRLQDVSDSGAIYLLPFKDAKADDTYYADVADAMNAGNTAPFIYSGWENTIVTTGTKMLDFIKGDATMEGVIRQLDSVIRQPRCCLSGFCGNFQK